LISLGIIGEYLGRIYDEVKERPLFLIDKTWGLKDASRQSRTSPD
jgi:dolichol-phosphate mannosyltransferase